MPRRTHAFSWSQPLLPQLADWLCAGVEGLPWDLSDLLVLVPTRQSARRLRAALAERARAAGTGVLPPRIVQPEWLETWSLGATLSAHERIAGWAETLLAVDLGEIRALVPIDPPRRDAAWALGLAEELQRLKDEFAGALLDFQAVAERVADTNYEPDRWNALARIEQLWRARLAERGQEDPALALRRRAALVEPPAEVRRVVLAGVADLSAFGAAVLGRWAERLPVEVVVQGGEGEPVHDEWGRPLPEALRGSTPLDHERCALVIVKDPEEAAARIAELAGSYRETPAALALGFADSLLVSTAAAALRARDLDCHDPAGAPLARSAVGRLARTLASFAGRGTLDSVRQLLREPAFAAQASRRGWQPNPVQLSRDFDSLVQEHLPFDLESAFEAAATRKDAGLQGALGWMRELAARFSREPFGRTLEAALREGLEGTTSAERSRDEREAAEALAGELAQLSSAEAAHAGLPGEYWPAVLERSLARARLYPQKRDEAWDLEGWVELAFEDAPHVVIAGLNEGAVPETIRGHLFLPDALRRHLGLDSNERRLARDRLILEAVVRARLGRGRVDILVPKLGAEGDPRQPSRLLFACDDADLVRRARLLFAPLPPTTERPPRRLAWRLRPLPARLPSAFSASAIRAYLDCPFRYYLEYGLRSRAVDSDKRDLDATDFGTLCHAALEAMAKDTVMREIEDEAMLGEFLVAELRAAAAARLGRVRSFAIQVQLEAAAARLRTAAALEAAERRAGWRTVETERTWSLRLGGHAFTGVIDRVDRHADGRIRVLDYKTADRARTPQEAHWAPRPASTEHLLPEALIEVEGKPRRWADLQLPLYVLAAQALFGGRPTAGYFVLPRTKEETAIKLWEELTIERLREAEACAMAVAGAVAAGRFWPPAPRPNWDEAVGRLFPDGVVETMEPGPFAVREGGLQ